MTNPQNNQHSEGSLSQESIQTNKQRMIQGFHEALLSAKVSLKKERSIEEDNLFLDINKNNLFYRKENWDFTSDFGILVYLGKINLDSSNVEKLISDLILDLSFDNFASRNRLSVFPEVVNQDLMFNQVLKSDPREFIYKTTSGYRYQKTISPYLAEECGKKLDEYLRAGFFDTIPLELIQKKFEVPGWTVERVLQVLQDGWDKVELFQLIELVVKLGYLVSEKENVIHPAIVSELDTRLSNWFSGELTSPERVDLFTESGYQYLFKECLMSSTEMKKFVKVKRVAQDYQIELIGKHQLF